MIHFKHHSGIYTLSTEQKLPITIEQAWQFLSSPENLSVITPPHMKFVITSGKTDEMYAGQIISYKVSPIRGIRTNWITEITHVQFNKYFIDEQRFGPYKMWHHEHHLEETKSGVIMRDKVTYILPLGILGRIAHSLFVKRQLEGIFQFREQKLIELFGR